MKNAPSISVSKNYLPDKFQDNVIVTRAYVAKLGFLRFPLNESFGERFFSDEEESLSLFKDYQNELYRLLEKSPHIMDITPKQKDVNELDYYTWDDELPAISIEEYLRMRVVLHERKRQDLFGFDTWWSPEEFTLFFNGALFLACAPVAEVPVATNIGQVSREFLKETLSSSTVWNIQDGYGPTPIHPDIFFVFVKPKDKNQFLEKEVSEVHVVKDGTLENLVVFAPDSGDINEVIEFFLFDIHIPMSSFYEERIMGQGLDMKISELDDLNQILGNLLSSYFSKNLGARLFSKIPGDIRKTLSKMHLTIQDISSLELRVQNKQKETYQILRATNFLRGLAGYLNEHMKSNIPLDKNAQLTLMNFASEETANNSIIQATLISSFVGVVLGGVITLLIQYLIK